MHYAKLELLRELSILFSNMANACGDPNQKFGVILCRDTVDQIGDEEEKKLNQELNDLEKKQKAIEKAWEELG